MATGPHDAHVSANVRGLDMKSLAMSILSRGFLAAILVVVLSASPALAGRWHRDFEIPAGRNGISWNLSFARGTPVHIVAKIRPAGWDPGGAVASVVPIRLVVHGPEGQIIDTGPHGGAASGQFTPRVGGRHQVQVLVSAPLGALGSITINY